LEILTNSVIVSGGCFHGHYRFSFLFVPALEFFSSPWSRVLSERHKRAEAPVSRRSQPRGEHEKQRFYTYMKKARTEVFAEQEISAAAHLDERRPRSTLREPTAQSALQKRKGNCGLDVKSARIEMERS